MGKATGEEEEKKFSNLSTIPFLRRDFLGPDSYSKAQEICHPSAAVPQQCPSLFAMAGAGVFLVSSVGQTGTTVQGCVMYFIYFIYLTGSGHTPSFSLPGILLSTFCRGKQQRTGLLPSLSVQEENSSCRRDFFSSVRLSGPLLLCSILKIHDIFFHLENLLPKLIVYFCAMKGICAAPYILAQFDLH